MIVVADTSPINYLVLIDAIDILPEIYQTIVIPKAIFEELNAEQSPEKVRAWLDETRDWFAIKEIDLSPDAKLSELDAGEVEAIELVKQLNADGLIIDDRAGRDEARKRGIFVIGTLGVLNAAAERGLIDLPETLRKLQQTSFRASDKLISELIQLDSERKRPH